MTDKPKPSFAPPPPPPSNQVLHEGWAPTIRPESPKPSLVALNTHFGANAGLGGVLTAAAVLAGLLSNGDVLKGLYHHDGTSIYQVAGAIFGMVFAAVFAYLGKPKTIA